MRRARRFMVFFIACFLPAAALVCFPLEATADDPPAADTGSTPIFIPDDAIQGVLVAGPESPAQRDPERAKAPTRAPAGQEVKLHGHIERGDEPNQAVVVGRLVHLEWCDIEGGSRDQLQPGALVEVQGRGRVDGSVEAELVKILPPRDPVIEARIRDGAKEFKEKYFEKNKRLEDEAVAAYMTRVGESLVPPYLTDDERRFQFMVVEDPTPNAFALPEGTIVVHSGLIARMQNEAQLATVLAHELAHVTDRHYIRAAKNETKQKLASIGALIARVALTTLSKDPDHHRAAEGISLITSAMISGYSRSFEDEADVVGLRYLYLAGYDVSQAPIVWDTFRRFYGEASPVDNYFYGSHSTATQREANLDFEIDRAYQPSGLMGGRIGTADFMRAMAPVFRRNGELEAEKGWLDWAESDLRKALNARPDDPANYVALGRFLEKYKGRTGLSDALMAYRTAVEMDPDHANAQHALGMALRQFGSPAEAQQHLSRALELDPEAEWAGRVKAILRRMNKTPSGDS